MSLAKDLRTIELRRQEQTRERERILQLPVYFQFKTQSSPNQCIFPLARYQKNPQNTKKFFQIGIVKDLDGTHTWRNAHTGQVMITRGVCEQIRNEGWTLKPLVRTKENEFDAIGIEYQEKFYIYHWVLLDVRTPELIEEWEACRRTQRAKLQRMAKRSDQMHKPIQLEF